MADITMCKGEKDGKECPLRETCHRFQAKPDSEWQSFFQEAPFKDDECEYEWTVL